MDNADTTPSSLEPEMNFQQKELVNSCFEEGQYESGIRALDQLRSPKYRPAVYHIQQLLYIALYPPNANLPLIPGSPSKLDKRRIKIQTVSISPDESLAAQDLLFSFAETNTLECLFNALPAYSRTEEDFGRETANDSDLANEALCIARCRSCWGMLVKDLVGQNKRVTYRDSDSDNDEADSVVATHAWPVLKWLIYLFEHDEDRTEEKGLPRHSPFLLEQVPIPRNEKALRWEADALLDIVFACLTAREDHRLLGARLLTVVINLACTPSFDFQAFVTSVYKRVSAQSDSIGPFLSLLSQVPTTQATLRFGIAFLHKCLSPASSSSQRSRPKPQARPRQKRVGEPSEPPHAVTTAAPVANKPPLVPSFADISTALATQSSSKHTPVYKFELLVSYGTLQSQLPISERDAEWVEFLDNESRWEGLLMQTFQDENHSTTLRMLGTTWH